MWNRIDPYDVLMQHQNRINELEQQVVEMQMNQMQMSNLINRQNKLIKECQAANKSLNEFVGQFIVHVNTTRQSR